MCRNETITVSNECPCHTTAPLVTQVTSAAQRFPQNASLVATRITARLLLPTPTPHAHPARASTLASSHSRARPELSDRPRDPDLPAHNSKVIYRVVRAASSAMPRTAARPEFPLNGLIPIEKPTGAMWCVGDCSLELEGSHV